MTLPLSSPFTTGTAVTKAQLDQLVASINALNSNLGLIQNGGLSITVTAGGPDGTANVTFATPFATTPNIVATNTTLSGNRDYGLQITAKSTTGFTVRAHHFDGTNAGTTISVGCDWIAIAL